MNKSGLENTPLDIQKLVNQRKTLRETNQFEKADQIRKKLENLGYIIEDNKKETIIHKIKSKTNEAKKSFLVLFGSGEISPTGRQIHEYIFQQMSLKKVKISIISTPAGFQPNVKTVCEEIAQFFSDHLINYHPEINIIYANNLDHANDPNIVDQINQADYIFTGPGSPTYALKNLLNTLLLDRIKNKIKTGSTLCLASAATVAFSHFCLPVYEIYKVGTKLYWEKGLNFYETIYKRVTIIPHLNNNEGGKKTDTSFCFMGRERYKILESLLLPEEEILGIDELTAMIIDLSNKTFVSQGKGKLQILKTPPTVAGKTS